MICPDCNPEPHVPTSGHVHEKSQLETTKYKEDLCQNVT